MENSSLMNMLSWGQVQKRSVYYELVEMVERYKKEYYSKLYFKDKFDKNFWNDELRDIMKKNDDFDRLNNYVSSYFEMNTMADVLFENPMEALNPKGHVEVGE